MARPPPKLGRGWRGDLLVDKLLLYQVGNRARHRVESSKVESNDSTRVESRAYKSATKQGRGAGDRRFRRGIATTTVDGVHDKRRDDGARHVPAAVPVMPASQFQALLGAARQDEAGYGQCGADERTPPSQQRPAPPNRRQQHRRCPDSIDAVCHRWSVNVKVIRPDRKARRDDPSRPL